MSSRVMVVLAVGWGCGGVEAAAPHDTSSQTSEPGMGDDVPLDLGIRGRCTSPNQGGYQPFYDQGAAILVIGDTDAELAFSDTVVGWYADLIDLTVKRGSDMTEADRQQPLWILGSPSTNPLFEELNGTLPAWFETDRFTFAGYRWEERGHGIAMMHPSPWADGVFNLVWAGNTMDGVHSLFSIRTGGFDAATTRGRSTLQVQGNLCHDDSERWTFKPSYADDFREAWEEYKASLEVIEGPRHTFYFEPGGVFDGDRDWMPEWQDERHQLALDTLELEPLQWPIETYLYNDRLTKAEVTGIDGNAHANYLNAEVHALYSSDVAAVGAHEDVHVLMWTNLGDAGTTLFGEGAAVMVDGWWGGEDLDDWAETQHAFIGMPSLHDLLYDFWGKGGGSDVGYGAAGHFAGFFIEAYGLDAFKEFYVQEDVEGFYYYQHGRFLEELEAEWLATLEAP